MFKTAIGGAVLIVLAALLLAGCSGQVAEVPPSEAELLAAGPDRENLPVPPDYVAEALEASGGLSFWMQQKRLRADGVVKLYRSDDSFYLTEQDLEVYPWSNAIRIEANEPQSRFVWQLADGQYDVVEGDPPLDVSPLAGSYQTYADAVLRIVTAPVRLLDSEAELYREPTPVRIGGQWYQKITVKYSTRQNVSQAGGALSAPYWTDAVYFLNREQGLIDMVWLGNSTTQEFVVARGYDYPDVEEMGLRVPSKVEVFRADADGGIRERLAQLDVTGN
jgi:hypothetical protein